MRQSMHVIEDLSIGTSKHWLLVNCSSTKETEQLCHHLFKDELLVEDILEEKIAQLLRMQSKKWK